MTSSGMLFHPFFTGCRTLLDQKMNTDEESQLQPRLKAPALTLNSFLIQGYESITMSKGTEYRRPVRKQNRWLISTDPEMAMFSQALFY